MARLEWKPKPVINKTQRAVEVATKKGAEAVLDSARRILTDRAKEPTGHLARETHVIKSQFEGGGYLVWAQPPGRWSPPYHAIFVEVGTKKMQAIPHLRPALKANKAFIRSLFDKNNL